MDAGLWQRAHDGRTLRSARPPQSRTTDGRREFPLSAELAEAGGTVLTDELVRRWRTFANSAWRTLLLTFTDEANERKVNDILRWILFGCVVVLVGSSVEFAIIAIHATSINTDVSSVVDAFDKSKGILNKATVIQSSIQTLQNGRGELNIPLITGYSIGMFLLTLLMGGIRKWFEKELGEDIKPMEEKNGQ